jgi:hypothetical protein
VSPLYVACKLCVPAEGTVNVTLAVEGVPWVTVSVPTVTPSSVNVTVPEGCEES